MEASDSSRSCGEELEPAVESLAKRPAFSTAVLAELGVKLVGLTFVLDGVGGLILNLITFYVDRQNLIAAGIEPEMHSLTAGGLASSFFYLFAGVYLVTNGKAVIELILMTDSKPNAGSEVG